MPTTVALKCESDERSYDQRIHTIIVDNETEKTWFGRPVDNSNCPILEWPKFAWKLAV